VVRFGDDGSFVLADIPGLIEGAHTGHGLGLRFLRHVSRTSLLVHLVDGGGVSGRDPLDDFDVINRELAHFDPGLAAKPQIVALNKIDLVTSPAALETLRERFRARGIEVRLISAATGAGVAELMQEGGARVRVLRRQAAVEDQLVEHG